MVDTGARGLLMLKPAPTMADTMAVIMGKGLPMPTLRLPLDAMEAVDIVVEVMVDTGARGLLMLKPAPTMADTMVVITAKGLPRLAPTTAAGVDMVATTERGLLMLRLPPTMAAGVDMAMD